MSIFAPFKTRGPFFQFQFSSYRPFDVTKRQISISAPQNIFSGSIPVPIASQTVHFVFSNLRPPYPRAIKYCNLYYNKEFSNGVIAVKKNYQIDFGEQKHDFTRCRNFFNPEQVNTENALSRNLPKSVFADVIGQLLWQYVSNLTALRDNLT